MKPLLIAMLTLGISHMACEASPPSVIGRWERFGYRREPKRAEVIQFDSDSTFMGRSYMDTTLIRGTFEQRGATVTVRSVYGYTRRLTLQDTILVMEDGTKYRRLK
jgi:hypothetical protein